VPYLDEFRATLVGSSGAAYLLNKILGHDIANKVSCATSNVASLGEKKKMGRKKILTQATYVRLEP
jgi:hypothetical protein